MRALTLTQPWAGLVASGLKLVENRRRPMIKREDFGKPFAIHASKVIDESVYAQIAELMPRGWARLDSYSDEELSANKESPRWYELSRIKSAVIAVATIDRQVTNISLRGQPSEPYIDPDQRRWFTGPIGYVLRDVRALATPVPCRGWQGFWTLTPELEAQVLEQLDRETP